MNSHMHASPPRFLDSQSGVLDPRYRSNSTSVAPTRRRARQSSVLLILVVLYAIADASSARLGTISRLAYLMAVPILALVWISTEHSRSQLRRLATVVFLMTAWFIPTLAPSRDIALALGDASTFLALWMAYEIFSAGHHWDTRGLWAAGLGLAGAATLATQFAEKFDVYRHAPPTALSFAIVAVAPYFARRRSTVAAWIMANVVLLLLSSSSGFRWALGQFALSNLLAFGISRRSRRAPMIALLGAAAVLAFGFYVVTDAGHGLSTVDRLVKSVNRPDQSDSERISEARQAVEDVIASGPLAVVFGRGHGATITLENRDNLLDRGIIEWHAVHLGPARYFHRYGLVGLIAFLWLLGAMTRPWRKFAKRGARVRSPVLAVISVVGVVLAIDSVLLNPLTSVADVISIGYVLAVSRSGELDVPYRRASPNSFLATS